MHRSGLGWIALVPALALAAPAGAQVLVGWGDSPSHGGRAVETFDCRSTTGSHLLVVSFAPVTDLTGVNGFAVDVCAVGGTDLPPTATPAVPYVPQWWDLSPGGCRGGGAWSGVEGFGGVPLAPTPVIVEAFPGSLTLRQEFRLEDVIWYDTRPGGSGWDTTTVGHFGISGALPAGATVDLLAGHEYYLATITVRNTLSTSCAGCCAWMQLNPVVTIAADAPGPSWTFGSTLNGPGAGWQTGSYACSAVPARGSTWGAIKSAYR